MKGSLHGVPAGLALQRPKVSAVPVEFTGEGQMQLNSLHMAEVLTDDSNFRQRAMDSLAAPMAHALSQSPQDFASAWLAGSTANCAVPYVTAVRYGTAVKCAAAVLCTTAVGLSLLLTLSLLLSLSLLFAAVNPVTAVCCCEFCHCCSMCHCSQVCHS